jgi:hypothetical protein
MLSKQNVRVHIEDQGKQAESKTYPDGVLVPYSQVIVTFIFGQWSISEHNPTSRVLMSVVSQSVYSLNLQCGVEWSYLR